MTPDTPILHVDMDAFYASVESIKDPLLKGRPVVVGGLGGRGVVTSASYEAREFGVRSAMPIVRARRLCPQAVFVRNDFDAYVEYSGRIREVFHSYSPLVEPLSLDEAFIDVGGSVRLFGSPREIALRIKRDVADIGLACTVGVAPNKFLAKLASTRAKPDGLLVIPPEGVDDYLCPLPIEALWGVGEQTGEALRRLGLRTVSDVRGLSRATLQRAVGESLGAHLWDLAHGIDEREVTPHEPTKSIGSEETFARDLDSEEQILKEILRLSERTAARLRSQSLCAKTITLKVRYSNFKTITRSLTPGHEFESGPEIYGAARDLYLHLDPERPRIRLLGVTVSGLLPGPPRRQMDLLGAGRTTAWSEATRAVDDIRRRFGDEAVGPATLLDD